MYSTCLFCSSPLGANESLERFPVGRRLAFDGEKGRLWVICPHCARWNLTPLEERWEAIQQAERQFRATRLRLSTDNIGLARLRDGTDLVRVGKPQRPELAAWRYGTRFAARRRRQMLTLGAAGAVVGAAAIAVPLAAITPALAFGIGWPVAAIIGVNAILGQSTVFGVRSIRDDDGMMLHVTSNELRYARLLIDGDRWGLKVGYRALFDPSKPRTGKWRDALNITMGERLLHGERALDAARQLLPLVNGSGAGSALVTDAVALLDDWGDSNGVFRTAATRVHEWAAQQQFGDTGSLSFLPKPVRLALEMSAHEDLERRAMLGELAGLEQAWKDAEEVAGIADDLLLPNSVITRLKSLKSKLGK